MSNEEIIKNLELAEEEYANSWTSIRDLAKKYNIQRQTFTGWLLAKGYKIYNRRASKSFDVTYFDKIDTEEKAYWLGFLFADGAVCQYNMSYHIELSLKIEDHEHVEKFALAIGKSYVNNNSTYRSRCIIGSRHMFDTLESYGCTRRKSLTLKFPDINIFKDKSLVRHFIRGYVDGDGCLSYCNKAHTQIHLSILGTSDFLDEILKLYGSNLKYRDANPGLHITKQLTYSGKSAFNFAKWLYEGATIYLQRKYLRYLDYCRLYQE